MEIFIVDDERVIAETLAIILRNRGYSVSTCTDPLKAMTQVLKERPRLFLCDHSMPSITGIELALDVTGRLPNCRAILFSANLLLEEQPGYRSLKESGRCRLLAKPLHPRILLSEIEALIGQPGSFQHSND